MIYLSIALVLIAMIAGFLVNKWLNQRQQELDVKNEVNTESLVDTEELSAAVSEMHKQFDARINKSFETIQVIKSELESLRLQIAIKRG